MGRWIDLADPTQEELARVAPDELHSSALDQLLDPARHDDEPRPALESHGSYIFGVFLVPVVAAEEDRVFYQEIDLTLTHDTIITVTKTPEGERPFDMGPVHEACPNPEELSTGQIAYRLVDEVAEAFLDLVDALDSEVDELEDNVEVWPANRVRARLSGLRHDLLQVRRTLAPTRDAIRKVVDNRVELDGKELFDRDLELSFADAYDKLLRATDALELARDLAAGVRDYLQAKISHDQNEVMKRLTVIASVLLLPTFIVGLYGQNFDKIPELHWAFGYWWSWGWIILSTIGQLVFFRWKKWI
ncbi:MAG: magnesium transporter, partial [Gaiellaceae bacterium]|nr:magnesium transporter [Gaiellaceae bacterium]